MPLVDSNDPALWVGPTALYQQYRADGTGPVGYERSVKDHILGNDHLMLKQALGIQPGQSIVLLGAGFGWVAEGWAALGLGPIAAADNSTFIQGNKTGNAVVPILNEDGSTNASRGRIRQALGLTGGNLATWCISEDVLPIMSDAEARTFASRMRLIGTNVAHWISVGARRFDNPNVWAGDARLNWKTLADWKALVTPDRVVKRGTATVL